MGKDIIKKKSQLEIIFDCRICVFYLLKNCFVQLKRQCTDCCVLLGSDCWRLDLQKAVTREKYSSAKSVFWFPVTMIDSVMASRYNASLRQVKRKYSPVLWGKLILWTTSVGAALSEVPLLFMETGLGQIAGTTTSEAAEGDHFCCGSELQSKMG